MKQVRKFRDLPGWQEARKALKEQGFDPNVIAELGELEGDSLDLVQMTIVLEEAFESRLKSKQ
jgi:acyl carrier protein